MFGANLKKEFLLDPETVFLNHGSLGAIPRKIFQQQMKLKEEVECNPDDWYRRKSIKMFRDSLEVFCKFIETDIKNTVFVQNVTVGLHSIMTSLTLEVEDAVLVTNLTYNAVKVLCQAVGEGSKAPKILQLDIKLPFQSKDEIVAAYSEYLQKHPEIKVTIVSHITSPTSIVMPVKEITEVCHSHGVTVIIDGAHVAGQLVDPGIVDIGADFYAGNIHKWMFCSRPSGFLWVSDQFLDVIRPGVVSHFHGINLHFDFCVRGTRDDTPYYTVPYAIQFNKELGGMAAIHQHNTELLEEAITMLTAAWGTERLSIPKDMEAPNMKLVQIPDLQVQGYPATIVGAGELDIVLNSKYKIHILSTPLNGSLYVRLSGHIYNCIEDYRALCDAILNIKELPPKQQQEKGNELSNMFWDLSPLADIKAEKK